MSQSMLHYEQGKLCYQNKKFEEAIEQFTEAIRLKPESATSLARCHNARGVVYFYLGAFKKVIKDCTKALELDPKNANYFNCRGNAYFSLGKFAKAADDFTEAIKLSPQAAHGRYYNNRGSAYRRLKNFKEAINDYTLAIKVDPKNGNYYNNRGNTYFDMGEFQLAIDDFTTALGLEPYSPKTKLTLAQAHEALAQEKRMKNSSKFEGVYSTVKKKGNEIRRKDRMCSIYVSPAGVEITFTRGWRKRKDQNSYEWSENMKIELMDDSHVKLFLDSSRKTWVVITPCDATSVEEELIGRITTKYASYSTACLVAQHESVVNEYTSIIASLQVAKEDLQLLQSLAKDATEQKDQFVKEDNYQKAEMAKKQLAQMESQIADKQTYIKSESERAESVRRKAEQEAGPVLDMVLIMQNRVKELWQSRFKDTRDSGNEKYKVEDLELEEQLTKMKLLVDRAHELAILVKCPMEQVESAFQKIGVDHASSSEEADDSSSEGDDDAPVAKPAPPTDTPVKKAAEEAKPKPPSPKAAPVVVETPPSPKPAPVQKAPEPEVEQKVDVKPSKSLQDYREKEESDESDWDELDDAALPEMFRPKEGEMFMTIESGPGGMVTITPKRDGVVPSTSTTDVVMVKKDSLAAITEEQKVAQERMARLEAEREKALHDLHDKDKALASLKETNESLSKLRGDSEGLKAQLEKQMDDMAKQTQRLSQEKQMTEAEKQKLAAAVQEQQEQVQLLRRNLESVNKALSVKVDEADAKTKAFEEMAEKGAELQAMLNEMKKNSSADKEEAERMKKEFEDQNNTLKAQQQQLQQALKEQQQQRALMEDKMEEQTMTLAQLRRHLAKVQSEMEVANAEAQKEKERLAKLEAERQQDQAVIEKMKEQAKEEELKRRKLHNLIQEIKGNIRVYIRIRPNLSGSNKWKMYEEVVGSDGRSIVVRDQLEKSETGGKDSQKSWQFEFDRIFWDGDSQQTVFDEIGPLVQSALDGYRVSIFAYGQTGSGKTFTMEGPDNYNRDTRGVIPRSVEHIFKHRDDIGDRGWTYRFYVTFLEVYNQDIRDLIGDGDASEKKFDIKLIEDENAKKDASGQKQFRTIVTDLNEVEVRNSDDLKPLLSKANKSRSSAATNSNERSSRSHSVFTMRIEGLHKESGAKSVGVLNLVDLAGSERIDKSGVTGQRLEETKAINSSLTCLGDVIAAIANGSKHVPFRNSKLTYLLQDSFGGGSKTLMFINLAGETAHLNESVCSLRFGAKVHDCHVGTAKKSIKAAGTESASSPAEKKKKKK